MIQVGSNGSDPSHHDLKKNLILRHCLHLSLACSSWHSCVCSVVPFGADGSLKLSVSSFAQKSERWWTFWWALQAAQPFRLVQLWVARRSCLRASSLPASWRSQTATPGRKTRNNPLFCWLQRGAVAGAERPRRGPGSAGAAWSRTG